MNVVNWIIQNRIPIVLFVIMWILLGELKERLHPHRNRANWTPEETREHLRVYHPDAYKALLEVEKEHKEDES